MAYAIVLSIVVAGIGNIEFAHELGKIGKGCFNKKMEVIVHKDITIEFYSINVKGLYKELQELPPICIVLEDDLPLVSATGDVVDSVGIFDSEGS